MLALCLHFIFPLFRLSGGWVGLFCPLRSSRCFCSPTHPPLHKTNTRISISGHTPSPNWLGSRISTELKMRKRVLQCDPGFHLSAMSVFAVMFILIFPRHVRRSIRFDFLFIRSSAVRRFYLRRFVRVIVCVGGLGFEIRV